MTTAQIQATIETVARQAGIPEDQRKSWVAGAKWALAQRYADLGRRIFVRRRIAASPSYTAIRTPCDDSDD